MDRVGCDLEGSRGRRGNNTLFGALAGDGSHVPHFVKNAAAHGDIHWSGKITGAIEGERAAELIGTAAEILFAGEIAIVLKDSSQFGRTAGAVFGDGAEDIAIAIDGHVNGSVIVRIVGCAKGALV